LPLAGQGEAGDQEGAQVSVVAALIGYGHVQVGLGRPGLLRRAFDAKFWGHVTTVQAVLPHLAPDGSITLLGGVSARAAMSGIAGIAAINGAVEALVKPLATELAPIRVNGVSPGFVDTPWWSGLPEDARRGFFAQAAAVLPVRRIATADDIADAVVLAATNPNLTGTVIETDGGARLVSMS
jgi:NAD(P)-dependent dehydrogenase (short-subunit alcohol dehydrogenase family)